MRNIYIQRIKVDNILINWFKNVNCDLYLSKK